MKLFKTDYLKEMDFPYARQGEEFVAEHRWYDEYLGIFKDADGALWGIYYCDPKTELQEDLDPFNDAGEVTGFPVEQREKVVKEWVITDAQV